MKTIMKSLKTIISKIPLFESMVRILYRILAIPPKPFMSSENYWIERYKSGENSGAGSYNDLAEFKAETLNNFVKEKAIGKIIEFGCGDGNQLKLAVYPSYLGFDISPKAIALCRELFSVDKTKRFQLIKEYKGEMAQLTLSLDVVYHLIEDTVFEEHMRLLFAAAKSYVIVYSSNRNEEGQAVHVKHRKFTDWVNRNEPNWKLLCHIPNLHPYAGDTKTGSPADFYIFTKAH